MGTRKDTRIKVFKLMDSYTLLYKLKTCVKSDKNVFYNQSRKLIYLSVFAGCVKFDRICNKKIKFNINGSRILKICVHNNQTIVVKQKL